MFEDDEWRICNLQKIFTLIEPIEGDGALDMSKHCETILNNIEIKHPHYTNDWALKNIFGIMWKDRCY